MDRARARARGRLPVDARTVRPEGADVVPARARRRPRRRARERAEQDVHDAMGGRGPGEASSGEDDQPTRVPDREGRRAFGADVSSRAERRGGDVGRAEQGGAAARRVHHRRRRRAGAALGGFAGRARPVDPALRGGVAARHDPRLRDLRGDAAGARRGVPGRGRRVRDAADARRGPPRRRRRRALRRAVCAARRERRPSGTRTPSNGIEQLPRELYRFGRERELR